MGLYHRLVARVWRRVEIEAFHLDLHLGLGDASRTAQATGWVCGALAGWLTERILPQARSVPEWRVTPDWDGVGVAGRAEGVFQIRASAVLATFLAAVWEGAALAVRRRSKWR